MNEADLIPLAQSGDSDAFALLMEQNRSVLTGTAYLMLRDSQLVEDAVQDALLQIWRALPSYRPTGSFRGWVVTILVHRVQKLRRRHRVDTVSLDGIGQGREDERDIEEEVMLSYDRGRVRQALRSLNNDQREVVILRYYAELTLSEIARTLGAPEGTIKSRLSRAQERLGAVLAQAGVGKAEA